MLAGLDRRHRRDGMRVIGRSDHDRVDPLLLFEHGAKIAIPTGVGILLKRPGGVFPIHVAERDDVLALEVLQVGQTLPANADSGNVEFFVGGLIAAPAQNSSREDRERRRQ